MIESAPSGAAQRPSPILLKEGIYQLGGAKGSGGCRVYLIRGTRKNMLIDAGLPTDFEAISESLGELGLTIEDIHIIGLTHEHMDHIGGVPFFGRSTTVAAHSKAANKILLHDEFVLMNKVFREKSVEFHIDLHLHHGTVFDLGGYNLQTLHTPGHCSGAICLYEPENQILFTGDTLFAGGTLGGIFPSGNISDYVETLQSLKNLQVKEIYPGHGRISTTPAEDFGRAINGSLNLLRDTKSLFDSLNAQSEFSDLMRAVSAYSKRI